MSSQTQMNIPLRKALVLKPSGKTPSHERHEHRLAEALRSLGVSVQISNLSENVEENYDWCILLAGGTEQLAAASIPSLHQKCQTVAACFFDNISTSVYSETQRFCQASVIDTILDFGLHHQSAVLGPQQRSLYHFVPNGLTSSEQDFVRRQNPDEEERSIPWVFVGHATADRVALINRLISRFDPRGFFNIPRLVNGAANPSQSLSQRQYESVLRQCRYSISFPQHPHFYLESERFRMSLLNGCVPIQVVPDGQEIPSSLPFDYLVFRESEVAEKLRDYHFPDQRQRFRADFLGFPSLAAGLATFLTPHSLLPAAESNAVRAA